ncbi:hypothetical protein [Roseixanthobacter glucoisosaccharinicivorans]|uniref:hypothetical protein n=1 Tax=Roseixanthobacter glucoisosaccharinicivorans TaxID=3119923 RepID=UPI00372A8BAB
MSHRPPHHRDVPTQRPSRPQPRAALPATLVLGLGLILSQVIGASGAAAQVGADPRRPDAPGPTLPAPRSDKNLSDRLDRTDGVIPPARNLDPELTHPAPKGGTMPVIPPPGSPGGNPQVQPK